MSLNLYLTIDGKPVDLWQTPTHITVMCLTDDDSAFNWELTGKKAKAAITRYIEWVRSTANGVYDSVEKADSARLLVTDHVKYVTGALLKARKIVAYAG